MPVNLPLYAIALLAAAGVVVGWLLGWLLTKYRLTPLLLKTRADLDARADTLVRHQAAISELKKQLQSSEQEVKQLSRQLLTASEERSAALSRLDQLANLEASLEKRDREIATHRQTIAELTRETASLKTRIEKENQAFEDKIALLQELRDRLTETYQSLSAKALKENNQVFIDLAKSTFSKYIESAKTDFEARGNAVNDTVRPLREALQRYEEHLQAMERSREKAYGGLSAQVQSLIQTQDVLQKETGKLVNALRVPHIRGRWGEITLKRVAELSGMQNHCDFYEQATARSENGILRPDMVVHLPGERQIVIDAKVPLVAYIDALETTSETHKEEHLATHARHVKTHINKLSQKAYWTQFKPTPEFVILFIPGENFFSAALAQDPQLIESGVRKNVILATPTTLISLLKTVAFGWQQEQLADNAKKISALGSELFERLATMGQHINSLGRDIERTTQSYNKVVGSLERRVFSSARKFKELGITPKDESKALTITPVETTTRKLSMDDSE